MKIDPNVSVHQQQQNPSVQQPAKKPAEQKSPATSGVAGDQVKLSADHQIVERLKAELNQLPEVRQDRVVQLRQALQSGSYKVTDEQIADAILSDTLR